jgi:hypothetical protein
MTKDEALKLALEALEEYHYGEARIILRQALEQLEQEPVAWEQFHEHLVERNFCPRCGKRTADPTTIHTCTPPHDNALQRGLARTKEVVAGSQAFYGFPHGPVSTPNAGGKCVTAGETAPIDLKNKGFPWTQKHNQAPQLFAAMPSNILPPEENT